MESLRTELRVLISRHGMPAVYAELQAEMRQTYEFLRQFYEPAKNNLVIPVGEVIPDRIATPHHRPIASTVVAIDPPPLELSSSDERKVIVTIESVEESEDTPKDSSLKEVVIQARKEMAENSEKITKAKHKEEVLKKHKELLEKGIRPESLLTKENLTKWLGDGLSYMRIAREHVGLSENEVSAMAKNFGLQSDIKKYIVMKKGSGSK